MCKIFPFRRIGIPVFIAVSLLTVSCSRIDTGSGESPRSYHIGINSNLKSAPVVYADVLGYFKESGVDVTVEREITAEYLLDGLYAGRYDFVCIPSYLAARDFLAGKDIRILSVLDRNQSRYVMLNPDQLENPSELAGKRIGLSPDGASEYVLGRFLLLHGVDRSDVSLQFHEAADLPELYTSGTVAAVLTWPPYTNEIQKRSKGRTLALNAQMGINVYWLFVTREDIAGSESENIGKILHALYQSYRYLRRSPEKAQKLIAEYLEVPLDEIQDEWEGFIFQYDFPQALVPVMENQGKWISRKYGFPYDAKELFAVYDYHHLERLFPLRVSIIR